MMGLDKPFSIKGSNFRNLWRTQVKNAPPTPGDYSDKQLDRLLRDLEFEREVEEKMDPLHHTMGTKRGEREDLLKKQVDILENDVRRLRMALRTVLPHAPTDALRYAEKVLEETR